MLVSHCHSPSKYGRHATFSQKTLNNSISHSLVIEQPKPLLDNDNIVPKAKLQKEIFVSHCHLPNLLNL